MIFNLSKSIEILERTPGLLFAMLQGISTDWTSNNEGGETWSVFDIVHHLIHGEKTDWIPRMDIILSDSTDKAFEPFDRLGNFEDSKSKTLSQLLDEFKTLRKQNIDYLLSKKLIGQHLGAKGIHPAFGEVTLSQLLATWTVHDLNHIAQISRVMAKQYKQEVGPWVAYLKILQQ